MLNWTTVSWGLFAVAIAWPFALAVRRVIRRLRSATNCESCGYDLRGLAGDRCPECGHLIARPLSLLRSRPALIHVAITIALLTGSHLANRADAIKARGWIAAMPTTALIPYVMLRTRRGRVVDSPVAIELVDHRLPVTAEKAAQRSYFAANQPGPDLPMTSWQLKWLIDRSLNCPLTTDDERTIWSDTAATVLNYVLESDVVTPEQLSRILHKVEVTLDTRPQWPVGSDMLLRPTVLCIGEGTWFSIQPVDSDRGFTGMKGDLDHRYGRPSSSWLFGGLTLGRADAVGLVQYKIAAWRKDPTTGKPLQVLGETRTVTTIVPTNSNVLHPITLEDHLLSRTPISMAIRPVGGHPVNLCTVQFYLSQNFALKRAIEGVTLGLRMHLKWDENAVGREITWTLHRNGASTASKSDNGAYEFDFYVDNELAEAAVEAGNDKWSLEIEGEQNIALCDFDATSYWVGKYEFKNIPVERIEK